MRIVVKLWSVTVKSVLPCFRPSPGPLPDKPPLTVNTPPEPTAPPRPPSATSLLRTVAPVSNPEQEFDAEVPFEFLCPITNKIMKDPVVASDGYNYERKAIRRWFRKKRTSPMTNEELSDLTVRANDELRSRIETFVGQHSEVWCFRVEKVASSTIGHCGSD